MKRNETPEPAVSYHAADEEVQLRSARSDEDEDLPAIYQEASFATVAPAAVPPPLHYSTLPELDATRLTESSLVVSVRSLNEKKKKIEKQKVRDSDTV